jgi:hypothetical protein
MLALRKWRAFRYKNCARFQTAGVSKRSRQRSTKVNPFDIACLAVYLEQQMSSILSHHEDLPSILMMRIITRSLMAAGPHSSRQDFLMLESCKLTGNGRPALLPKRTSGCSDKETRRRLYDKVDRRSVWMSSKVCYRELALSSLA